MAPRKTAADSAAKKDEEKKDTPGSGDSHDTSGKAATDQSSDRKDSGQKGAAEDKRRREMIDEALERAAKAADEGGVSQPVTIVASRDRLLVVGDEYRDHSNDPDFEAVDEDGNPFVHPKFEFDRDAKRHRVDHIALASTDRELVLEIDGTYYSFAPELGGALARLVRNASTNLNL